MCMLQGVSRAQAESTYADNNLHRIEPLLVKQFVTVEIRIAEADGAQHRARGRLLQAVDDQAGVLTGICNFFCAHVRCTFWGPARLPPRCQLPVSTMRRSRRVMMTMPASVTTPPTMSRPESTSPSRRTLRSTENTGESAVTGATLVTG